MQAIETWNYIINESTLKDGSRAFTDSDAYALCDIGDEIIAELTRLRAENEESHIAFAQWFRSGNNRRGRTEKECFELWQALSKQSKEVESD